MSTATDVAQSQLDKIPRVARRVLKRCKETQVLQWPSAIRAEGSRRRHDTILIESPGLGNKSSPHNATTAPDRTPTTNKTYVCPKDGDRFNQRNFVQHMKEVHWQVREWYCSCCGETFKRPQKLREHCQNFYDYKPSKDELKLAMRPTDAPTVLCCGICGECFGKRQNRHVQAFVKHLVKHSKKDIPLDEWSSQKCLHGLIQRLGWISDFPEVCWEQLGSLPDAAMQDIISLLEYSRDQDAFIRLLCELGIYSEPDALKVSNTGTVGSYEYGQPMAPQLSSLFPTYALCHRPYVDDTDSRQHHTADFDIPTGAAFLSASTSSVPCPEPIAMQLPTDAIDLDSGRQMFGAAGDSYLQAYQMDDECFSLAMQDAGGAGAVHLDQEMSSASCSNVFGGIEWPAQPYTPVSAHSPDPVLGASNRICTQNSSVFDPGMPPYRQTPPIIWPTEQPKDVHARLCSRLMNRRSRHGGLGAGDGRPLGNR
ncbi:hypothetical protein K431DRAFT_293406 [Polychaeton citri CBS 116435]|uniref:C2H2-type domain-containing protein n=1 Tax=Polychaeton citri CBS 116435 TaxID=1314669 RepID=A0A9P4URE9_9PEZI|nr:hypothetical protein K431DRAFT_293406 [Polychaeton citri CBS 116435]